MTHIYEKARRTGLTYAEQRRQLITMIHIARTQLAMDKESYRANLAHYGNGKISCTEMTVPELETVLEAFKKLGFKPLKTGVNKRLSPIAKQGPQDERSAIRAIWIFMGNAGFIQDNSETALNNWVKRMTAEQNGGAGIAEVQWLKGADAAYILNILKGWGKRCLYQWMQKNGYEVWPQISYAQLLRRWERIHKHEAAK